MRPFLRIWRYWERYLYVFFCFLFATYEYELSNQLNTVYNSNTPVCVFLRQAYCVSCVKFCRNFVKSQSFWACVVLRVYERGHQKKSPAFAAAKGGENMNEPNRTQ